MQKWLSWKAHHWYVQKEREYVHKLCLKGSSDFPCCCWICLQALIISVYSHGWGKWLCMGTKCFIVLYQHLKIYRTIILPVVLYGCEAWSLTLREERKLRVFENMVLRRIFEHRRDEVTGEWRRLHNEELSDLYSSPIIVRVIKSRRMRWAGHVARMGEERRVYKVLVGKSEGRRPLGRPRRWWVDNIRTDLQEVGCRYVDWIGLAQDRDRWRALVRSIMNLRVPWNAGNFLTSC